jgi:hypothetical protein
MGPDGSRNWIKRQGTECSNRLLERSANWHAEVGYPGAQMSPKKSDRDRNVATDAGDSADAEIERKADSLLQRIERFSRLPGSYRFDWKNDLQKFRDQIAELASVLGENDPTVALLESKLTTALERRETIANVAPVKVSGEPREINDLRRLHVELINDLINQAEAAGLRWDDVLDRAGLPKGSRSRVNSGDAGLPTIAKVRRVIEAMSAMIKEAGGSPPAPTPTTSPEGGGRWVVVEGKQGTFFGYTDATDTEIAERGHVRLRDCRSIRGEASASTLAVIGPRDSQQVGLAAPSALILGVLNVYDCTANAVKGFTTTP